MVMNKKNHLLILLITAFFISYNSETKADEKGVQINVGSSANLNWAQEKKMAM